MLFQGCMLIALKGLHILTLMYDALSGLYVDCPERAAYSNIGCSPMKWQRHDTEALKGRNISILIPNIPLVIFNVILL
jgi:hypothetical protein